jgi:multiple sugar transport system ATP-binding protein
MARIQFNHVYKRYGKEKEPAVKDFNLQVNDKEFLVFVGPSGCGKSTSLRMLAGLEDISEGEICINDNIVNQYPPRDRNISMVFQNYALYPNMSVYENIAFGLRLRKIAKHQIDISVKKAARTLEIESLLNRRPKELSGGQRQRVALGRAIVRIPDVFLMDEPLSNLDAKLRVQMRSEIINLHKKIGVTTIYVTHDQIEAMTMGDRIVVMNKGVIQQVDTPQNIYFKPKNIFVAGFIGSPPINFIEGKILKENSHLEFHTNRFKLYIHEKHMTSITSMNRIGYTTILGIRPEHISFEPLLSAPGLQTSIQGTALYSEFIGSDRYYHLDISSGKHLIIRADPFYQHENGKRVTVYLNMEKALFFHPNTGDLLDE